MLKHMLKKSSPPLPNEIRDRILHKTSKRLSRDRSSFLEKKRKSSRKRERTREDSQFKTSNSKIRQKETRRPIDRLRKKKNYEIMKSYSINSCHSVSIEKSKKTRERRKKGTSSRSKAEYGGNQGKFKGSSNYISRSFLRSGGDNKQMLKISDKLRTLKANYNK